MFWRRFAVYNILLLCFGIKNACAEERQVNSASANQSFSQQCLETAGGEIDRQALKDQELAPQRGRCIEVAATLTTSKLEPELGEPGSASKGSAYHDTSMLCEIDLEQARLDDSELGQIKGGAFDTLVPDIKNLNTSEIILWDESKVRLNASLDQVQGSGQIISTISTQGR
jgi:hypothetical protein